MEKLYYNDSHITRFTAKVTACEPAKGGYAITLDATAFYPEGGGQACDLGLLNGVRVLDVKEKDDTVVHLCEAALAVGEQVTGEIDWQRRFDLMQQHTGEHIVSGIINKRYGWHNVGFHVGAQTVTIDFDGPIPEEDLEQIQWHANQAVWENRPVHCWYPSPEELPSVGYRTKRELPWPVRVVEVPEYDKCACCGVHVKATGEIGLIKLLSCVKFHQGVRIEMVCGGRALNYVNQVYEQNRRVSQLFSAKILETATAAQRINDQLAAEKFRAAGLEKRIFAAIATGYAGKENVLHLEPELAPGAVRELADAIAQRCDGIAVVASSADGENWSICLVSREKDVRELGKAAFQVLNGRGGGKPGSVQGSVRTTEKALRQFFADTEEA